MGTQLTEKIAGKMRGLVFLELIGYHLRVLRRGLLSLEVCGGH